MYAHDSSALQIKISAANQKLVHQGFSSISKLSWPNVSCTVQFYFDINS